MRAHLKIIKETRIIDDMTLGVHLITFNNIDAKMRIRFKHTDNTRSYKYIDSTITFPFEIKHIDHTDFTLDIQKTCKYNYFITITNTEYFFSHVFHLHIMKETITDFGFFYFPELSERYSIDNCFLNGRVYRYKVQKIKNYFLNADIQRDFLKRKRYNEVLERAPNNQPGLITNPWGLKEVEFNTNDSEEHIEELQEDQINNNNNNNKEEEEKEVIDAETNSDFEELVLDMYREETPLDHWYLEQHIIFTKHDDDRVRRWSHRYLFCRREDTQYRDIWLFSPDVDTELKEEIKTIKGLINHPDRINKNIIKQRKDMGGKLAELIGKKEDVNREAVVKINIKGNGKKKIIEISIGEKMFERKFENIEVINNVFIDLLIFRRDNGLVGVVSRDTILNELMKCLVPVWDSHFNINTEVGVGKIFYQELVENISCSGIHDKHMFCSNSCWRLMRVMVGPVNFADIKIDTSFWSVYSINIGRMEEEDDLALADGSSSDAMARNTTAMAKALANKARLTESDKKMREALSFCNAPVDEFMRELDEEWDQAINDNFDVHLKDRR